jgi:tetratricopeptide (TPR) repeat protein
MARRCAPVALLLALLLAASTAWAQDPISDALAHEDARRWPEAAAAYRLLLARALDNTEQGDLIALTLLGLERVWHESAQRDSMLPVVNVVLARRPGDPVARTIQFRSLSVVSRDGELREAFLDWRRAVPGDAAPWREYVRTLMAMGRPLAADSALAEATAVLGRQRDLANEAAQIAAALERWHDAARAWRTTIEETPWLETAAAYSLQRAPSATRDSVRTVLLGAPVTLEARRLLSTLEVGWGDPRRGWAALASVRSHDSMAVAWQEFGERAESMNAWSVARDVWTALFERSGDASSRVRAAESALAAGDPSGALTLLARSTPSLPTEQRASRGLTTEVSARPTLTTEVTAQRALTTEVKALGELGRAEEAARRVAEADRWLDADARAALSRVLVTAWLRAGNVERARAAAEQAGALDDDATIGWLALYEGDLTEARRRLVRATVRDAALTDALAVLARTRVLRHRGLGEAFLTLARRDTVAAAARFGTLADSLPDAAPVLLGTAARLSAATGDSKRAVRYWEQVVAQHATAAEAPEALLELARALARAGDAAAAAARYESLIIDHAGSAMVPQARRELERLRGRVPGAL